MCFSTVGPPALRPHHCLFIASLLAGVQCNDPGDPPQRLRHKPQPTPLMQRLPRAADGFVVVVVSAACPHTLGTFAALQILLLRAGTVEPLRKILQMKKQVQTSVDLNQKDNYQKKECICLILHLTFFLVLQWALVMVFMLRVHRRK